MGEMLCVDGVLRENRTPELVCKMRKRNSQSKLSSKTKQINTKADILRLIGDSATTFKIDSLFVLRSNFITRHSTKVMPLFSTKEWLFTAGMDRNAAEQSGWR